MLRWICLLLAPVFSWGSIPANPPTKPKVMIEEIKPTADLKKILVPAKVVAQVQSTVTADTEGHVVQILKNLGSSVRAGETIMLIENKDPGFTYAKVPVKSPITGVISQMAASQMSKVSRTDKLFTVINPKTLKIFVELSSQDSEVLRPGSEGTFKFGEAQYKVKVSAVSPLIDSRTGTAPAELVFSAQEKSFPTIGTIGQVSFEITQGQIILIPESALMYFENKPHLRFIGADLKTEKRSIELGEQRENLFVVKSGLKSGDKIVVRSSRPIKDGEAIEIEEPTKN